VPALRRIERVGEVVDGELATDTADGGREFCSVDGDLFALFEGQRVRVTVEVQDDDQADGTEREGSSRGVSG